MNKKLSIIFLILGLGNIFAAAQDAKEKNAPTGLILEITFIKGRPPAYLAVNSSSTNAKGAWYAGFTRVPNFQNSAEKPLVEAVRFVPFLEDGAVKIRVTAMSGEKSFDREEIVGLYSMREGERLAVKELTDYGIMPFEIAVNRAAPAVFAPPSFESRARSLEITAVEPNYSTLPSYKVSVLNSSSKAVSAFTYNTIENNRKRISGTQQNLYDETLIESGATLVRTMSLPTEYKSYSGGETPKPASGQTFVITSVIFTDGSYEGDASEALRYRASVTGKRIQIKQIIALLDSFVDESATFNWNRFAEQSARLESKVVETEFDKLSRQFPALGEQERRDLRESIETAADIVKQEFIKGTNQHRDKIESSETSRIYLTKLREVYRQWLARLA